MTEKPTPSAILEKIAAARNEEVATQESENKALEAFPGVRSRFDAFARSHFQSLSYDISREQKGSLTAEERGRNIEKRFDDSMKEPYGELKARIPIDDGDVIAVRIRADEYPRTHMDPNSPTYTVDLKDFDYVYVIGTDAVRVESKARIEHELHEIRIGVPMPRNPQWERRATEGDMADLQGLATLLEHPDTSVKSHKFS